MFNKYREQRRLIVKQEERIVELELQLREARDLKEILNKITNIDGSTLFYNGSGVLSVNFPPDMAQYVDDYFGGKVIKQEAIKVIEINKNGEINTGLTKQKPDRGYSYKLIRK